MKKDKNSDRFAAISNQNFFLHTNRQTDRQTDIATARLTWPRGRVSENVLQLIPVQSSPVERFCKKGDTKAFSTAK